MAFNSLTEDIYIEAIKRIQKSTKGLEGDFIDLLIEWILKLDTKGGFLLRGRDNQLSVGKIDALIDRFLRKTGYAKSVTRFLKDFDLIDEEVKRQQKIINGEKVNQSLITPHKKAAITRTTSDLVGNGLSQLFKQPIKDILFDSVISGGSLTDITKQVRTALTTSKKNGNGLMVRYVNQVSRDALQQYNGRINNAIRRELKLNAYIYVNSLVEDSRPQCIRWHKMEIIKTSQLNKEIDWAFRNGKGMIKGTTKDTFAKFRGGYACRHEAIPTRK